MADIAKMYRQIQVAEQDTWLQCILWRDHPHAPLQMFRLTTVTYGEASSSLLACRALHEAGEDHRTIAPKLADVIQRSFYVHNLMLGASSTAELTTMKIGIQNALQRHGFPLRKWASNDASILEGIPPEDLAPLIHVGDHDVIKTLEIAWSPRNDSFRFFVDDQNTYDATMTKRQLASEVLRLYDPLGIMQSSIITAKIQGLWRTRLKWEDHIHNDTLQE